MANPVSGYVLISGVGYVPRFDLIKVGNGTKSIGTTTQVITTSGKKKAVTFDKIFGYLEKAVGLFGSVAEGIAKINAGKFPKVESLSDLEEESEWLGSDPDGVKVDNKNNPPESQQKSFFDSITATDALLGVGILFIGKQALTKKN